MYESYERILKALNLEKHLTARQIAKLLYPDEQPKKAYQRVAKNLQYLRKENLLKSKAYGLGKEDFWSLRSHPIVLEEGYKPPRHDVGSLKYEHEKACAEVFVVFALTGTLYGWEQHKRLGKNFIPDRTAEFEDGILYIEVEMGTKDRVTDKLRNYQNYYRETREPFQVLFLVQQMRDWKVTPHYRIELLSDFLFSVPNSVPNDRNDSEAETS